MTGTYYSSTFSSTSSNPPIHIMGGLERQSTSQETGTLGWLHGNKVWSYSSTNTPGDCATVNFFTDAFQLGMRPGDIVLGVTASGGSTHVGFPTTGQTSGVSTQQGGPWIGVITGSSAGSDFCSTVGGQISTNYLLSTSNG